MRVSGPMCVTLPALLLALLTSWHAAAQEDQPSQGVDTCAQGSIATVRIAGCSMRRCEGAGFDERLLRLTELAPGVSLSRELVDLARARLLKLGYFRRVDIRCEPGMAGVVDVVIAVTPLARVRRILIEGNRQYYDTVLTDRLAIQRGDGLDPEDPKTLETLERIQDTIRRMYVEDGFRSTQVTTEIVPAGPAQVDLMVRIVEGERKKVAAIDIRLEPRHPVVPLIGNESCPIIKDRHLRTWAGLGVGKPFTERTISDATRRLTRALRSIGFSGIRIEASFDPDIRTMTVNATYDTCHLLRFFVRDRKEAGRLGFGPFEDQDLLEALAFSDSGVFDATEASLGQEEIRQFFENRGYLLADVTLDYRTFDRSATSNVAGQITYLITLNGRREIRRIRVSGNKAVDTDEILEAIDTRTYDFFGDMGAVLPDQVFYDLDKIVRLYATKGYHDVSFEWTRESEGRTREIRRERHDIVYTYAAGNRAFRVRVLPQTEGVYLEIGIREGPRSLLGEVSIEGNRALSPDEAQRISGLAKGGAFYAPGVAEAARRIVQHLGSLGYLEATATVRCQGHDPEVPFDECQLDAVRSATVDVVVTIEEGPQTRLGVVFVDGPNRTSDEVVVKDFPKEGSAYDAEKVAEAIRRLKDLGIFTSVQVSTIGGDEKPRRQELGLVINARETRSRFIDLAGGFETMSRAGDFPGYITSPLATSIAIQDRSTTQFGRALGLQIPDILLSAEVRYTDQNFLGRAKRLYLPFKFGLSATSWHRYAGFTPTYVDPRFFARGLSFRVTPFAIYDRATTRLDMIEFGSEFALSKELLPRLFAATSYEIAGVKTRDPETTSEYTPFRLENKVTPTLTYDRLDHPVNPTRGGMLQTSLAYINAMDGGNINNFIKWDVSGKYFLTLRKTVTLGVMARYGASKSFNGPRLPDDERFTLGGNRGVRGFSDDGVGQYHPDGSLRLDRRDDGTYTKPYGGEILFAGSLELRFPLLRTLSFYGAVFYDVGALAERVSEISASSFRSSVGAGIRFLLGGTIPIRLDYGVILDPRCRLVDAATGTCVQQEEVGNIHFGILYTF